MKVYKNCSSLSIYLLDRIFDTRDLRYLVVGFNDEDDTKLNDKQNDILDKKYTEIIHEYGELTVNRSMIKSYKLRMKILELRYTYDTTIDVLKLYVKTNLVQVFDLLNDLDWKVKLNEPHKPQIDIIIKKLKGIKNKIKIQESNFNIQFASEEDDIKSSLEKDALRLEMSLGLNRRINTKETSVVEWTNLTNLSIEKNKPNG